MFKLVLSILVVGLSGAFSAAAEGEPPATLELVTRGVYQGKNLYVQNPLILDKTNFCTRRVYVNQKLIIDNPMTSAYEINLSFLNLNDTLEIKIVHSAGCAPKIINPQVIRAKSRFEFVSTGVDDETIRWFTRGEALSGKFLVEQKIHEKWVIMQVENSAGSQEYNQYEIPAYHQNGLNQYRIRYMPEQGNTYYSGELEFYSDEIPVTFDPAESGELITLSREADYEILDASGNLITSGAGKEIDINALAAGLYYLNIENKTERFYKK